jgi:hypothetical protein
MRITVSRLIPAFACLAALSACGGGGGDFSGGDNVVVAPPTGGPPAQQASFDVVPCFTQDVLPGRNLARLVIPDTLSIDLSQPATFPNGRTPADPVIDRTLAMVFLDLRKHSIDTFHNIPLNPKGNDKALPSAFPWLAGAFGGDRPSLGGSNFNFRTDPESAYVRVDRMGMPAIATALVGSSAKDAFNDDSPAQDLTAGAGGLFKWVPEFRSQLTALTNALADDFKAAGVSMCATPTS